METFKIACDVDEVLGAFYPAICKKYNMPELQVDIWDGVGVNKWVADKFPELYNDLDFWKSIPRLSNPSSINFEIDHYITSIPDFLHDIREQWLLDNGFPKAPLICTLENKVKTMKALGINVLIDDKPTTVQAVRRNGMIAFQFVPPYMSNYDKTDPFTITHLSQVNGILEKLK